jgi:hypothetical protein
MDGCRQLVAARTAGAISSAYLLIESDTAPRGAHPSGVGAAVATLVGALAEWASGNPSLVTIDDLPSTV